MFSGVPPLSEEKLEGHPNSQSGNRQGTHPLKRLPAFQGPPVFLLLTRPEVQGQMTQGPGTDSTFISHLQPQLQDAPRGRLPFLSS